MKKTLSKILSVLLIITVILGVTAIGVSADDSNTLSETEFYVAGTLISNGYYLVADGGITAENATAAEPQFLASLALTSRFFPTSVPWEDPSLHLSPNRHQA